jgi:hypothetical protein
MYVIIENHFVPLECKSVELIFTSVSTIFLLEELEDTKGAIRICKLKKIRQHNGQKKKYKQRSTKHTHKTKDRVTRTPLKAGDELRC